MRTASVYEVVCDCGQPCESESETMTCPKCGATFRVQWKEQKEEPKN